MAGLALLIRRRNHLSEPDEHYKKANSVDDQPRLCRFLNCSQNNSDDTCHQSYPSNDEQCNHPSLYAFFKLVIFFHGSAV